MANNMLAKTKGTIALTGGRAFFVPAGFEKGECYERSTGLHSFSPVPELCRNEGFDPFVPKGCSVGEGMLRV